MATFFNRNGKGSFNESTSIVSVYHGTNSYLLEDELNELQWNQIESRANENRTLYTDGIISDFNITIKPDNTGYYIESKDGKPLKLFINGYFLLAGNNEVSGADSRLFIPFITNPSLIDKKFVIYIETWLEAVSYSENLRKFGGINTPIITNSMLDSRINKETSRRLQLRWRLKSSETIDGGLDIAIPSKVDGTNSSTTFAKIQNNINDTWFANVGTTLNGDASIKSDGQIFAIPLFVLDLPPSTTLPKLDMLTTTGTSKLKQTHMFKQGEFFLKSPDNTTWKLTIDDDGTLITFKHTSNGNGSSEIVLMSPDNTKWKLTIDNNGILNSVGNIESVGQIKITGGSIIEVRTTDPAVPEIGQMWVRSDL